MISQYVITICLFLKITSLLPCQLDRLCPCLFIYLNICGHPKHSLHQPTNWMKSIWLHKSSTVIKARYHSPKKVNGSFHLSFFCMTNVGINYWRVCQDLTILKEIGFLPVVKHYERLVGWIEQLLLLWKVNNYA